MATHARPRRARTLFAALVILVALGVMIGISYGGSRILPVLIAAHVGIALLYFKSRPRVPISDVPSLLIAGCLGYGLYVPVCVLLGADPADFTVVPVPMDLDSIARAEVVFLAATLGCIAGTFAAARIAPGRSTVRRASLLQLAATPASGWLLLALAGGAVAFVSAQLAARMGDSSTYADVHSSLRGLGGVLAAGLVFAHMACVFSIAQYSRSRRPSHLAIAAAAIGLCMTVTLFTGARNHIVNGGMVALAAWSLYMKPIRLRQLVLVALVGYLPVQAGSAFRYLKQHGLPVNAGTLQEHTPLLQNDLSNVFHAGTVLVDHVHSGTLEPMWGSTYLDALGRSLPYSLFPLRPLSAAERFALYVGDTVRLSEGTGFSMPFSAEGYWNFGHAGAFAAAFGLAWFLAWVSRTAMSAPGDVGRMLVALAVPHAIWAARADFASIFLRLGVLTFCVALGAVAVLHIVTRRRGTP